MWNIIEDFINLTPGQLLMEYWFVWVFIIAGSAAGLWLLRKRD